MSNVRGTLQHFRLNADAKVGVKGEICGRATIERAWRTEHGQHWFLRSPLSVILQKKKRNGIYEGYL